MLSVARSIETELIKNVIFEEFVPLLHFEALWSQQHGWEVNQLTSTESHKSMAHVALQLTGAHPTVGVVLWKILPHWALGGSGNARAHTNARYEFGRLPEKKKNNELVEKVFWFIKEHTNWDMFFEKKYEFGNEVSEIFEEPNELSSFVHCAALSLH